MTEGKLARLEQVATPVESKVFKGVDIIIPKDRAGIVITYQDCKFPIAADCIELFTTAFTKEIQEIWELYRKK